MRTALNLIPAVTLALIIAGPARAEDTPIIVSGRGLGDTPAISAYDVQTMGRDALLSAASGRIEDALSGVAGFQQFRRSDSRSSNPSAQGVTLRALGGNATSRSLVLLDGVPMADPFFGFVPLSALAPERLASARVTRGGGSGAFGAGAVAGTIELTSAGAEELGLLNASGLLDDRGDSELSSTLAPRLGDGFAVVSARWDRGEGFWTTPASQRVPASVRAAYESWSVGLRGVAPISPDVELQARGLVFNDARTLRFAGADTAASGQDASLRLVGRGTWQFDALAYVQARDFSNVVISSSSFRKTLDQYGTPATGLGGKLELRPPVGDEHVLRLGGDWRIGSGKTQEIAYNASTGAVTFRRLGGGHQSDLGLFAEDDWSLGALVLTAGARADRWSQTSGFFHEVSGAGALTADNHFADRSGWEGTFRGGARASFGAGLALRGAAYTGLRLPTLNELYRQFVLTAPTRVGATVVNTTITTQANANLKNERLRGFEAGFDYTPTPGVTLTVTAFDDRLGQAIANVTIGTNLRRRMNIDAVHARGLELGTQIRAGQVSFAGSLALTRARVEASGASVALNGMRPAQTPAVAASATLGWHPKPQWDFALTLRHTGGQYEDDLQTDLLPPATTVNAYVSLPVAGPLVLVLRGENLTDTQVLTRNQGGSIDLGAPRTLWAGLRVNLR
ncbi:MAG: TonB-dependent receptor, partial [Novosphingobium sp.]